MKTTVTDFLSGRGQSDKGAATLPTIKKMHSHCNKLLKSVPWLCMSGF